jgi:lipopolysaccharide exporter
VEERTIRSISWTLLSYWSSKAITVATTLILARLLVPEEFGLVALAWLVIGLLSLFNDLGLGGALIVRQDFGARDKGAVLAGMMIMGAAVAAIVAATSPLAAALFDEPRLTAVLAVLAGTVLIDSVTWFYDSIMQRELEFRRRFAAQLTQTFVYAIVAIALAALGLGVWSMVVGRMVSAVVHVTASLVFTPYRVRPVFDRKVMLDAFASGRGFLVQGGVAYVGENVDYLAVGRLLGAAPLGIYSMAYRLGEVPYWAIADPVAQVTFPSFARMWHRGEDVAAPFLTALRLIALVACPLGVVLSAAADPFVRTLLGDKWLDMIGPLAVLGVWAAVRPVEVTAGWLLNSVGKAGLMGAIASGLLLLVTPGVFLAAHLGGITAVAWVMLVNVTASLFILAWVVTRRLGVSLASQWRAIRPVAIAAPGAWAAARVVAGATGGSAAALELALSATAGFVAYAAVVSLVEPGLLRHALAQLARTLRRAPAPAGSR